MVSLGGSLITWPGDPVELSPGLAPALEVVVLSHASSCTVAKSRKTGKGHHVCVPSICFQFLSSPTEVIFEDQLCLQGVQTLNLSSQSSWRRLQSLEQTVRWMFAWGSFIILSLVNDQRRKRGCDSVINSCAKKKWSKTKQIVRTRWWSSRGNHWKIFGLVLMLKS